MCWPGQSPFGQLGLRSCCGTDASSSRRRVTSSRIIAGGVPVRYPYVILLQSEFVRSCLSISIQSTFAVSSAWLRSVQYTHKNDWTMC